MNIKILSRNDVKKAVAMPQAIDVVRQAFISFAQKKAILPLRTQVPVEKNEGITLFMPAYLPDSESLGAKIVSVFPQNVRNNKPTIHAVMIICDAHTGQPSAMMDGSYLTALRTGAVSGVATDLMALTHAETAAIFGAGIQGRTQLEAICCVREIQKVMVFDKDLQVARTFAEEMQGRGRPIPENIVCVDSPEKALAEAEVVCTATTSSTPVFEDIHLKPGVHINGVGSYTPEMQEIPEETVVRAKVVVDSFTACLEEAGDLIIPLRREKIDESHIQAELGQMAQGSVSVRKSEADITFFKSVGLAIQDVAVAQTALQRALELGLGMDIEI
jgi:ornithine cyclodeaminase